MVAQATTWCWCTGGAAGIAAAFALFRRPSGLAASGGSARLQWNKSGPRGTCAASAVSPSVYGLVASGGIGRRTQLARASVLSSEVDEADDEPAPVDPEQVRPLRNAKLQLAEVAPDDGTAAPRAVACCCTGTAWSFGTVLHCHVGGCFATASEQQAGSVCTAAISRPSPQTDNRRAQDQGRLKTRVAVPWRRIAAR